MDFTGARYDRVAMHQLDQSFAPRSRQITTPVPHHSLFTGRVLFLLPNQQHQSTESKPKH